MKKEHARAEMISQGWVSELLRYIIAGGIAFLIDFSVLMLFYKFFGMHYLPAAAMGLVVGLTTTYFLSIKWVFKNRALSNKTAELGLFLAIGSIGFLINEWAMWLSVERMLLSVPFSKVVATGIVFIWNFTARKVMLFREQLLTAD